MTDFRRTLLWMIFITSLVFLWDSWQRFNGHPSLFFPAARTQQQAAPAAPASAAAGVPASQASSASAAPATAALPAGAALAAPAPGEQVTVTTDVFKATIDSNGGTLSKVELLRYADQTDPKQPIDLFDTSAERFYQAQSGLIGGSFPNHTTPMRIVPGPRELGSGDAVSVRLESPDLGGLQLIKTYTFHRGSYLVDVKDELVNTGTQPLQPKLYLQLVRDGNHEATNVPKAAQAFGVHTYTGPAIYNDAKKFQKVPFEEIEKGKVPQEPVSPDGWVAMVQHYFATAWIVPPGEQREFFARKVDTNKYAVGMIVSLPTLAPQASQTNDVKLFVGPQEERKLETIAPGLELVKDYGWFTIFAKPLFWLLEKLHGVIGNWGWAIVALTVLVKGAFFPLQAASYRSMAKMKAITPRMTELRERHKNDPQRMNQAMMELYRTEKVNPLGGCLPVVVQIPIFIALYWVLLSSVEMRGAPWILWIHDLSQLDPYYILPAVYAATMFLQIKLNPTPPDPMQARLMWMMPAVFSIMFFFFPAGLVLYWLTNNTLSITQQWYINKKLGVK
ncbi:MAG: membrane protein insertase YidC [Betaproteobacteria bacterium]|nr:membrane protein insertase YidC [Betaproteobacteria bacterium]